MKRWLIGFALAVGVAQSGLAQELRLRVKLPLTTMDPHFYATFATASAHAAIWERLFELDANGQPVPALAESWRVVDPLTWELELRRGVRFHECGLLTTQDVLWSFARAVRIERRPSSFSRYIAGVRVEAVDDFTLRLVTDTHEGYWGGAPSWARVDERTIADDGARGSTHSAKPMRSSLPSCR